jgi:hypothetical protein
MTELECFFLFRYRSFKSLVLTKESLFKCKQFWLIISYYAMRDIIYSNAVHSIGTVHLLSSIHLDKSEVSPKGKFTIIKRVFPPFILFLITQTPLAHPPSQSLPNAASPRLAAMSVVQLNSRSARQQPLNSHFGCQLRSYHPVVQLSVCSMHHCSAELVVKQLLVETCLGGMSCRRERKFRQSGVVLVKEPHWSRM